MIQQRTIVSLNQQCLKITKNVSWLIRKKIYLYSVFWIFDFLHKHFLQNVTFWVIFKRLVWLLRLYKQKVKCSISDDGLGNEDVYFLMLLDLDEKMKHKVFFSDKLKKKGHLSFFFFNFLCYVMLTLIFCLFCSLMTLQDFLQRHNKKQIVRRRLGHGVWKSL